jgi:hypothetical protein
MIILDLTQIHRLHQQPLLAINHQDQLRAFPVLFLIFIIYHQQHLVQLP